MSDSISKATYFISFSSGIRVTGSERDNGMPCYDRFPSQSDEFDEIEEVVEEYSLAPLFQRIHISGDDTSGVSLV